MSNGVKRMILNTRERVVSIDHNRLQRFIAYDRAEMFRRLMDCRIQAAPWTGGAFLETGSYTDTGQQDVAPIGTPLRADVFDGLVVLPQPGSLNLFVSPGVVMMDDPDGQAGSSDPNAPNPDDSRYKLVVDPGIQLGGALVLAASAGGGIRIDIIECQRTTVVTETTNRDIFDPSTGLFTPVSVQKVDEGRLVYRVRSGSPAGGIPSLAQGWLPLCVASVPNGATSVDQMTFWDVRPLVKDRINAPLDSQSLFVSRDINADSVFANDFTDTSKLVLNGSVTAQIGMYRAGGVLQIGTSGLNVRAAANQAAGYNPLAGQCWFLYALFPANLPRWVRYTDAPATPRIPAGPLGILTVASQGPTTTTGFPIVDALNTPNATGLLTTGPAVLLLAGAVVSGPKEVGLLMQSGQTYLSEGGTAPINPDGTSTTSFDRYRFVANTQYPKNAHTVLVAITTRFVGTPNAAFVFNRSVDLLAPGTNTALAIIEPVDSVSATYDSGGHYSDIFTIEVPCVPFGANAGLATDNLEIEVDYSASIVSSRDQSSASIVGWKI